MASRPNRRGEGRSEPTFVVSGIVEERETGRPLARLIVRAFDRDLVFDDDLGYGTTDDDGRFQIRYGVEKFRDVREARPDLYLRIYDPSGARVVHETTDAIRENASENEHYRILIPARALSPERGSSEW